MNNNYYKFYKKVKNNRYLRTIDTLLGQNSQITKSYFIYRKQYILSCFIINLYSIFKNLFKNNL